MKGTSLDLGLLYVTYGCADDLDRDGFYRLHIWYLYRFDTCGVLDLAAGATILFKKRNTCGAMLPELLLLAKNVESNNRPSVTIELAHQFASDNHDGGVYTMVKPYDPEEGSHYVYTLISTARWLGRRRDYGGSSNNREGKSSCRLLYHNGRCTDESLDVTETVNIVFVLVLFGQDAIE